jgi:secreted PhoX family phosphatase
MKHFARMALMVGVAAGALWAVSGNRGYTQAADPNAAPNPYKMQDNWLQLPEGRQLGGAIKVQVDHSDGKSIWVFDRCSSNACNPIQKFDSNGKFVRGFGANMFNQPHGLYVDNEGNVWAADNGARKR